MDFNLTIVIVILTCITSYQAFNNPELKSKLLFVPARIKETKEWYRFLSHGLIHADWIHLAVNMYVLYTFGGIVELYFSMAFGDMAGRLLYLLMYFGGIAAASIYSYYKHQNSYYYSALGASGAVSGIVFAFIFFDPWSILLLFFIIPMPAVIAGILYLWYSSYMGKKGRDNIGHDAHFYGAVFGFLFIIVAAVSLRPDLVDNFFQLLLAGPDFSGVF